MKSEGGSVSPSRKWGHVWILKVQETVSLLTRNLALLAKKDDTEERIRIEKLG
jgi:hypothetical protein